MRASAASVTAAAVVVPSWIAAEIADASDVAISNTFGPNVLTGFQVWTDEVPEDESAAPQKPRIYAA